MPGDIPRLDTMGAVAQGLPACVPHASTRGSVEAHQPGGNVLGDLFQHMESRGVSPGVTMQEESTISEQSTIGPLPSASVPAFDEAPPAPSVPRLDIGRRVSGGRMSGELPETRSPRADSRESRGSSARRGSHEQQQLEERVSQSPRRGSQEANAAERKPSLVSLQI